MQQHQHLGIVDASQRYAAKIAHADVDRHPDAVHGTTQHDTFTMKFDLPYTAVGARIICLEADGQTKRVEPQCTARPGGIDPACSLTPHGIVSPPGLCSRSIRDRSGAASETA